MKVTMVDLHYKMKDILTALDRNEEIHILYRGEERGIIIPAQRFQKSSKKQVKDLAFFGMSKDDKRSVEEIMNELRSRHF